MAANPSIQLGTDGNWAIKEDNLLAYKQDGTRFFNKEFDFSRNSLATFVDKDGLIKVSGVTDTELIVNGDLSDGTTNWSEVTGGDATSSTIVSGNGHPTNAIRYVSIGSSNRAYAFNDTDLYEDGKLYKFEFYYRSDVVIGSTGTSASLDWKSQVGALPINTGDAIKVSGYVTADSNDNRFAWYTSSTTSPGKFFEISGLSVVEVQTDVPRIDFKDNTTGHLLFYPRS